MSMQVSALLTGNVAQKQHKGAWKIVDNGYLNWSTTVPPFKNPLTYRQLRWSKWLESMRKDVECVFGILKGRCRILKVGIRVHGIEATDNIWLTCCALHNMLLCPFRGCRPHCSRKDLTFLSGQRSGRFL